MAEAFYSFSDIYIYSATAGFNVYCHLQINRRTACLTIIYNSVRSPGQLLLLHHHQQHLEEHASTPLHARQVNLFHTPLLTDLTAVSHLIA